MNELCQNKNSVEKRRLMHGAKPKILTGKKTERSCNMQCQTKLEKNKRMLLKIPKGTLEQVEVKEIKERILEHSWVRRKRNDEETKQVKDECY